MPTSEPGRGHRARRRPPVAGAVLLLAALGGCAEQGLSGRDAELARRQAEATVPPMAVSLTPDRQGGVTVWAAGREIVLPSGPGRCVLHESLHPGDAAGSALFGPCDGGRGPLFAVSIAAEPLFDGPVAAPGRLDEIGDFMGSARARALLGLGEAGPLGVARGLEEITVANDVLYLRMVGGSPLANGWRALLEVNRRMVLVTAMAMSGEGPPGTAQRAALDGLILAIRRANGRTRMAGAPALSGASARAAAARPDAAQEDASAAPPPRPDPPPPLTEGAAVATVPAGQGAEAVGQAPGEAPSAPLKPRRG